MPSPKSRSALRNLSVNIGALGRKLRSRFPHVSTFKPDSDPRVQVQVDTSAAEAFPQPPPNSTIEGITTHFSEEDRPVLSSDLARSTYAAELEPVQALPISGNFVAQHSYETQNSYRDATATGERPQLTPQQVEEMMVQMALKHALTKRSEDSTMRDTIEHQIRSTRHSEQELQALHTKLKYLEASVKHFDGVIVDLERQAKASPVSVPHLRAEDSHCGEAPSSSSVDPHDQCTSGSSVGNGSGSFGNFT